MMTRRLRWVGLALATVLASGLATGTNTAVRADDPEAVSGDLKSLQGKWTTENEESTWEFDGEKMKATVNGQDYRCKVTLNPKATPYPTLDFAITEGPGDTQGLMALGIYKLEGDSLTICVAIPGNNPRPTELKAVEDESHLFKLKRVK
jgi:uncharacterized protein (TIGR03067 family)